MAARQTHRSGTSLDADEGPISLIRRSSQVLHEHSGDDVIDPNPDETVRVQQ